MARRKLSEHKAKTILHTFLGLPYEGVQLNFSSRPDLSGSGSLEMLKSSSGSSILRSGQVQHDKLYVIKVDQGVKGRMKKGLVSLNVDKQGVINSIEKWQAQGYSQFIIEEMFEHDAAQTRFISLEREREGVVVTYSTEGGVDIESHKDSVKKEIFSTETEVTITQNLNLPAKFLKKLVSAFDEYYFSFLEINPLVVTEDSIHILDLAVEVDDAAEFFVKGVWDRKDYVESSTRKKTEEEHNVEVLARDSQASLKLDVFNPQGAIFLLLSGGGASIVVADEAYTQGYGKFIADYGEYSGNPNDEETYTYTKNLVALLLKSSSQKKVLIIAGGVANFTDIRKTFSGVIRALEERSAELRQQEVKVFVRRGGPYQKEGLKIMKEFLEKEGLYGFVSGPELILTDIVKKGIEYIK